VSDLALTGWALVAAVAALIGLWVALGAASRLDRLHRRVRDSRSTLDSQLVRRATAALDLAVAGVLDPVSSVLVADAAREALDHLPGAATEPATDSRGHGDAADVDQAMAESELSRVLRAALGDAADRAALAQDEGASELLERLDREWYRVQLARRFHNDAVVARAGAPDLRDGRRDRSLSRGRRLGAGPAPARD
jgi:hypothetical protein